MGSGDGDQRPEGAAFLEGPAAERGDQAEPYCFGTLIGGALGMAVEKVMGNRAAGLLVAAVSAGAFVVLLHRRRTGRRK